MISSDVQEATLQIFLEVTKNAVESQAQEIQGESQMNHVMLGAQECLYRGQQGGGNPGLCIRGTTKTVLQCCGGHYWTRWVESKSWNDWQNLGWEKCPGGRYVSQCLLVILPDLIYFSVWPDMTIRLCQFHIIKAITQWAKSKPKAAEGKKKPSHHGLTDESLPKLLDLFRKAQRARSKQSWKSTHSKSFIKGVHELQREFGCKASVILE